MSANAVLAKVDPLETPPSSLGLKLVRNLACNAMLFQAGDAKACIYRIVSGIVFVYGSRPGGNTAGIEFAFSGDLVGMGFLSTHVTSARAISETQVVCLPLSAADHVDPRDQRSATRLKAALQREFEHRREELRALGRGRPVVRVAAFLLTLSRRNASEGRDPHVIDDVADCFEVASNVGLSVGDLGVVLAKLKEQGILSLTPSVALQIADIAGLERIVDDKTDAGTPVLVCDCNSSGLEPREAGFPRNMRGSRKSADGSQIRMAVSGVLDGDVVCDRTR